MRVFVAGATGVIGRRAVRALVAAGHEVTAAVRSPAKAALARSLGATPVEVDLFDADAVRAAVAGHDAVCNLATHIPPLARAAEPRAWAENTRIRTEGSRNLVDAALAANASVYVQESIAFLYGDHGDEWLDAASTPIGDNRFAEPVRAAESEAKRFGDSGGRSVVLRFGLFLAPDSEQMLAMARSARRGISVYPGNADGFLPSIHARCGERRGCRAHRADRHVRRGRRRAASPRRAASGAGLGGRSAPARSDARAEGGGRAARRFSAGVEPALPRGDVVGAVVPERA